MLYLILNDLMHELIALTHIILPLYHHHHQKKKEKMFYLPKRQNKRYTKIVFVFK